MDTNYIINRIKDEDIIKLLDRLGSDVFKENNNEIIFYTICHHQNISDASPKLYYYKDSKQFRCFSNCGNMSLFDLVMNINNCTFLESIKYIKNELNLGVNKKPKKGIGSFKRKTPRTLEDTSIEELPEVNKPFVYTIFSKSHIPQWEKEDISYETLQKYNIRLDKLKDRVIIPHFDINGRTVGIRTRLLNPIAAKKYGKYLPLFYDDYAYSHSLGKNLYGLNYTKENIKNKKKVFIFEGEKSVLKFETMYPGNNIAVATCGSSFSNQQKKMLLDLGVTEIIIAYDRQFQQKDDDEYIQWWNKIEKITKNLVDIIDVYVLWDIEGLLEYKDSPLDKGKEVFEKLLKNKIKVGD